MKMGFSLVLVVALLGLGGVVQATTLTGNLTVDNGFTAYISTNDSVAGDPIGSGGDWTTTYSVTSASVPLLSAGLIASKYYLHVMGSDWGSIAAFLGDFTLSDAGYKFANGTQSLLTNTSDWKVSASGFGSGYVVPTVANGNNGVAPWGTRSGISSSAMWIWTNYGGDIYTTRYFSTEITAVPEPGTILAALSILGPAGFMFRRRMA